MKRRHFFAAWVCSIAALSVPKLVGATKPVAKQFDKHPYYEFSQQAIKNINTLLWDPYWQTSVNKTLYFTTECQVIFLQQALGTINAVPPFSFVSFEDTEYVLFWKKYILDFATIIAQVHDDIFRCGKDYRGAHISDNMVHPQLDYNCMVCTNDMYLGKWRYNFLYLEAAIKRIKIANLPGLKCVPPRPGATPVVHEVPFGPGP